MADERDELLLSSSLTCYVCDDEKKIKLKRKKCLSCSEMKNYAFEDDIVGGFVCIYNVNNGLAQK